MTRTRRLVALGWGACACAGLWVLACSGPSDDAGTAPGSGGVGSANVGGAMTGGLPSGGAGFGGTGGGGATSAGTGGLATGGVVGIGGQSGATGGLTTGGGGSTTGGVATGGATTGGAATGGMATGGMATGGVATGGAATGGAATGGAGGFNPCPTNGEPCQILPFGDSITNGVASSDQGGYRSRLFSLALAANQDITFLGSESGGPNEVDGVAFPKNHEGHSGWTIDPNYSPYGSGGISSLVPSPAFDTVPDIVLLMIGTNDVTADFGQDGMADRLDALLGKIVQAAPDALVVVAQLTPVSWNPQSLRDYNAQLPGIVDARAAQGEHIVLVDMSQMPLSSLASDSVHPNDQGYDFMADVWYSAISDLLPTR